MSQIRKGAGPAGGRPSALKAKVFSAIEKSNLSAPVKKKCAEIFTENGGDADALIILANSLVDFA